MEKRISDLSRDPHTVSLTDRKCSLFIDPQSGSIFVDEGDGEGRMNGVVFSPKNNPSFSVRSANGASNRLVLDYCGVQYLIGVSDDGTELREWAASANSLLTEKGKRGPVRGQAPPNGMKLDAPTKKGPRKRREKKKSTSR